MVPIRDPFSSPAEPALALLNGRICAQPFRFLEIREDGNCYPCCPGWSKISYGNIFTDRLEDIWNGETARRFRRSILDGSYCWCDFEKCRIPFDAMDHNENIQVLFDAADVLDKYTEEMPTYPEAVAFGHDAQCNVLCVMCRDCQKTTSLPDSIKLDSMIDSLFLPLLAHAKRVICSPSGEIFASGHSRKLIRTVARYNTRIRFTIRTNGLLCDQKNCDELGITDQMDTVIVSLHASNKKLYDRIVRHSDFDRILRNIEWLAERKRRGQLASLRLVSVVSALNYMDMPEFVGLARRLAADVTFTEYFPGESEMAKQYREMAISKPFHPEYDKFVAILCRLQAEKLLGEKDYLAAGFRNHKPRGWLSRLKSKLPGGKAS